MKHIMNKLTATDGSDKFGQKCAIRLAVNKHARTLLPDMLPVRFTGLPPWYGLEREYSLLRNSSISWPSSEKQGRAIRRIAKFIQRIMIVPLSLKIPTSILPVLRHSSYEPVGSAITPLLTEQHSVDGYDWLVSLHGAFSLVSLHVSDRCSESGPHCYTIMWEIIKFD